MKRSRAAAPPPARRARALDEDVDVGGSDEDDFGNGSDGARAGAGASAAAERVARDAEESADGKRLRLAREYLHRIARSTGAASSSSSAVDHLDHLSHVLDGDAEYGDEDEDGEDERVGGRGAAASHAAVSERLSSEALRRAGALMRPIGAALKAAVSAAVAASAAGGAEAGTGAEGLPCFSFARGHSLSATCVALAPDGSFAFSGSKDCSVLRWDIREASASSSSSSASPSSSSSSSSSSTAPSTAQQLSLTVSGRYPGRHRTKADVARQLNQAADVTGRSKGGATLPVFGGAYGGGRLGASTLAAGVGVGAGAGAGSVPVGSIGTNGPAVRLSGGGALFAGAAAAAAAAAAAPQGPRVLRRDALDVAHARILPSSSGAGGGSTIVAQSLAPPSAKALLTAHMRGLPDYGIAGHFDEVLSLALSSDAQLLATGSRDRTVRMWRAQGDVARLHGAAGALEVFVGHKDAVHALSFRPGSRSLFSGGADRTVKQWACDEGAAAHIETLFGHQADIHDLECSPLGRERVLTCGRDRTTRLWKVPEQTQLLFRAHSSDVSVECVRALGAAGRAGGGGAASAAEFFVTGAQDGSLSLWNSTRKRPVFTTHFAHGTGFHVPVAAAHAPKEEIARRARAAMASEGGLEGGGGAGAAVGWLAAGGSGEGPSAAALEALAAPTGCASGSLAGGFCNWVTALAVLPNSDLVASGSGDGFVRLWRVVPQRGGGGGEPRSLEHIGGLALRGIVTGLAFSGGVGDVVTLAASVGQEHRLGRWWHYRGARNGLAVARFRVPPAARGRQ